MLSYEELRFKTGEKRKIGLSDTRPFYLQTGFKGYKMQNKDLPAEASLARRNFSEGGAKAGKIEKIRACPPKFFKEKFGRVHIFISGHVQGVFFRNETCKKAKEVGLTGWIRNLEDPYVAFGDRDGGRGPSHGRVEAVFEGEKENVKKMIKWLKRGPILAKVEKVEVIFEDYKGEFKSFEKID